MTEIDQLLQRLNALMEEHGIERYVIILESEKELNWRVEGDKFWAIGATAAISRLTSHDFIQGVRGEGDEEEDEEEAL